MNDVHYPQNVEITLQDFEASGWKDVITNTEHESYLMMWRSLSSAARTAIGQGQVKTGKVLSLLADACSLRLCPSSPNEPFKTFAVTSANRSSILDELLDSELKFFAEIVDSIDQILLKARISDLLWVRSNPRNYEFALKAIDAYRSLSLDEKTWVNDGQDCWERAVDLAQRLRKGAGERLPEMDTIIFSTFETVTCSNNYFGLSLANLLKSYHLGQSHRLDVAKKLEFMANEFNSKHNFNIAREYFNEASTWYKLIPDQTKATEMILAVAEGWANEAGARIASENSNHMVAVKCYENAIQVYRTIPKNIRSIFNVEKKIDEMLTSLNDAGDYVIGEMKIIKTSSINTTQLVESAIESVTGQETTQALLKFSNLHGGIDVERIQKETLQRMREQVVYSILPIAAVSTDGRVISRRPSFSLNAKPTEEDDIAINAEMIRQYCVLMEIVVNSQILPALNVLSLEHRLRETDFIKLARDSNFVPKDRANLFGKALFAGYEHDFVTAIHLLVPQIEHLVRMHLKQAGIKTTNLDIDSIQNENGMSTLMSSKKEVDPIFGKNLAFELRSLFCEAYGPNLRNELAHGLLDDEKCNSAYVIYAWWFALRLTVNTWWNSKNTTSSEPEENEVNNDQTPTTETNTEQS